jgi:hypothetical protein
MRDEKGVESQLIDLLAIPVVNSNMTYCNNVHQIYKCFGIEAVRTHLIKTIYDILNYQNSNVDIAHVILIVDFMVFRGEPTSITYVGVAKQDTDPLSAAGFSHALQSIKKGAAFGRTSPLTSTIPAIMVGRTIPTGTGQAITTYNKNINDMFKKQNLSGKDFVTSFKAVSSLSQAASLARKILPVSEELIESIPSKLSSSENNLIQRCENKQPLDIKPIYAPQSAISKLPPSPAISKLPPSPGISKLPPSTGISKLPPSPGISKLPPSPGISKLPP